MAKINRSYTITTIEKFIKNCSYLTERESKVLCLRLVGTTQNKIAEIIGLKGRDRVAQIEAKAARKFYHCHFKQKIHCEIPKRKHGKKR